MHSVFWIKKATNIHSEYVIIIAFPLQQWLKERASMIRYTFIDYIVVIPYYWYISKYVSGVISTPGFRPLLPHMLRFCSTNNEGSWNKCPFPSNFEQPRDSECSASERLHTKCADNVQQVVLTAVPSRGRQLKVSKAAATSRRMWSVFIPRNCVNVANMATWFWSSISI
jgi:hypothetical protein